MRKKVVLFAIPLLLAINNVLLPQSKSSIRNIFYDAESWILFEDFKEALPKYQELLKYNPSNSNYLYRIGQCYTNIPGEKAKAISYLEEAIKNINPKYRIGKFRETGAPYDALYYLANAYRINDQLDKALDTYTLFKKNMDPGVYDSVIVNQQIESCYIAKKLMETPVFLREINLGKNINETTSEFSPVISENEKMLVFSKSEPFYDALLYSINSNGSWSIPLNMNEILKVDRDFYPASISNDGKDLYLYSTVDYDGIIYRTTYDNGTWSPIIKLNDNINTKFWESHATISHDNKKIYFTSNRKGTYGGLDIYVSPADSTGEWGTPVNLGSVINSPYNEDTPFLSKDDKTLFFSSRGHYNMGGYDVFYSTLQDNGEWSVPVNVGYPFNTTDDDVFFRPLNEGYEGYLAKYSPRGYGKQDIFRVEVFSDVHPRKFLVKGIARGADPLGSVKVSALKIKQPGKAFIASTNPGTGEFNIEMPHGIYGFTFEADGSEKISRNIELPLTNPSDTITIPAIILAKNDFTAELAVEGEKNITVTSGDPVFIPLRVEPNSILTGQHWHADSLLSSEKALVTTSNYRFKVLPEVGMNRVAFQLADRFGNTAGDEVIITRIVTPKRVAASRPEPVKVSPAGKPAVAERSAKPDTVVSPGAGEIKKVPEPPEIPSTGRENKLWYLWLIAGAGLIILIIIFLRRKKKNNNQDAVS